MSFLVWGKTAHLVFSHSVRDSPGGAGDAPLLSLITGRSDHLNMGSPATSDAHLHILALYGAGTVQTCFKSCQIGHKCHQTVSF